jgi:shikimate dehydrogenase
MLFLRSHDVLGANVTIPFKETVAQHLDGLGSSAEDVGAVNTICKEDGKLIGYNTDRAGFTQALRMDAKFDPLGRRAVVVGAGGSARAVLKGLLGAGAARIDLLNRTLARAEALAAELEGEWRWKVRPYSLEEKVVAALEPPDLLVNCTPYGMKGGPLEEQAPPVDALLGPSTLVVDLVYNPLETPLLRKGATAGARTLGGLPMLIYQGMDSFRLWTGREAPVETMFEAARVALGGEVHRV